MRSKNNLIWLDGLLFSRKDPLGLEADIVEHRQQRAWRENWDPVDLLVPEWQYLLKDPLGLRHEDEVSGLTLSRRERGPGLRPEITRVLAVERLRKVNALVGFHPHRRHGPGR